MDGRATGKLARLYQCLQRIPLPGTCILCGYSLLSPLSLCKDCRQELPWLHDVCQCCGIPLPPTHPDPMPVCGACLAAPPPYGSCRCLFAYRAPVNGLIARFKFDGDLATGKVLGRLLQERFLSSYQQQTGPDLLVPVPLHDRRLRQRGFNQALELARPIARVSGIPLCTVALTRLRQTPAQSSLDRDARRQNLAGVFGYRRPIPASLPAHVAIIDDVVTTGATVAELSRLLWAQGARRIDVWAVARA